MLHRILFLIYFVTQNCSEISVVIKTYNLIRVLVKYALQKVHCRVFFEAVLT